MSHLFIMTSLFPSCVIARNFNFPEADKLCGRLCQKLNSVLGHKIVMDHMPLLMVCLEVCELF